MIGPTDIGSIMPCLVNAAFDSTLFLHGAVKKYKSSSLGAADGAADGAALAAC